MACGFGGKRSRRARRVARRKSARPRFARALSIAGFSLLEAIVALAIFSAGSMALYGLFNSNLVGLGKAAEVSRREPAVLAAVEHLASINIREERIGQLAIGEFDIAWSSSLVEPVRQGQSVAGFLGNFEIGLYDVDIELSRNGEPDMTYRVRLAGHRQVRRSELLE